MPVRFRPRALQSNSKAKQPKQTAKTQQSDAGQRQGGNDPCDVGPFLLVCNVWKRCLIARRPIQVNILAVLCRESSY